MSNSFSRIVVCVPERWREGRSHIKGFIEHYCEAVGKKIVVDLSPDMGVREIWVADAGKLSRAEYEAADCAIQILNEGLTRAKDIVWNNRLPETKPASGVTGQ